jgi:hypothetical protein
VDSRIRPLLVDPRAFGARVRQKVSGRKTRFTGAAGTPAAFVDRLKVEHPRREQFSKRGLAGSGWRTVKIPTWSNAIVPVPNVYGS